MVSAAHLTLYLAICLDFRAFVKQSESICAKLNDQAKKERTANLFEINQTIKELIKHHVFVIE